MEQERYSYVDGITITWHMGSELVIIVNYSNSCKFNFVITCLSPTINKNNNYFFGMWSAREFGSTTQGLILYLL